MGGNTESAELTMASPILMALTFAYVNQPVHCLLSTNYQYYVAPMKDVANQHTKKHHDCLSHGGEIIVIR